MNSIVDKVTLGKDAIAAIEGGNLIQAIKVIRTNTGLGLKESKDVVEAYLETHPAIKAKFQENKTQVNLTQETVVHLLLIAAGLAIACWIFLATK